MENRELARLLHETADLMEVAGEDPFRIRSYRKAADAVESCPERLADLYADRKRLLALPGIGVRMADNISEMIATGRLRWHDELLERYRPEMLELLKVQGLGPKTVALIWETHRAASLDEVESLARAGRLRELPRLGAKAEEKILRAIASYRSLTGRTLLSTAARIVEEVLPKLAALPGIKQAAVAGSFRRGRETVGDLDFLVAGPGLGQGGETAVSAAFLGLPGIVETLAEGENKITVRRSDGLQMDLRLLPEASFGAALQYFTGSQQHNVKLRQRAQRRGAKLNEYGLFDSGGALLAGASEEGIYAALGLDWIPPELREDGGEIEAAEAHALPALVAETDLRGDLHMHTVATDGRATIEEMAAAAQQRGYAYIAITDHSQALAMARGLDETRALEQIARIRAADAVFSAADPPLRIFAGIEVDIHADGALDLHDTVLAQMDVVIASVHSRFDLPREEMTERLLRAIANPHVNVLGHPSGRLLLRREPYHFDFPSVLAACREHGVALEINASPERLDLNDAAARACGRQGVRVVINTDAHHPRHLDFIRYGVATARRGWLTPACVLNTLPADRLLACLKKRAN